MQKDKIFALLKQHGKSIAADATDEQLLAALAELVSSGKVTKDEADKLKEPSKKVIIDEAVLNRMATELLEQKQLRIRQEFQTLAADRPFLDEKEWLPKLYADETLMETIRKMPIMKGGLPVQFSVENNGNAVIEAYRKMKPGAARKKFALENYHGLNRAHEDSHVQQMSSMPVQEQLRRLYTPQAANSYSATLVTDRLADEVITTIGTRLASLRAFSREFGTDRFKPRANVDVKTVTAAASFQTNPTDFEPTGANADSTVGVTQVAVDQCIQEFQVANDELNKGLRLMDLAEKAAQSFANGISDKWTAIVTVANFGAGTVIGAAASFDQADLPAIWALAKNYGSRNLILDGSYIAGLIPLDKFDFLLGENGAYAFDLIAMQNRWTSAMTNAVGLICDPNAIACASGLPVEMPQGEFIELNTVTIEQLGLTIQLEHWWGRGARKHWMAYDVMAGFKAGDTTAAEGLVSA